jgi:hypothetical protein
MSTVLLPQGVNQMSTVLVPLDVNQMSTVLLPPGVNQMCIVLLPPGVNQMSTVLLPPGVNQMCIVLLPPGVNQMFIVLLPPGVNQTCTVLLPLGVNQMYIVLLPPGVNQSTVLLPPRVNQMCRSQQLAYLLVTISETLSKTVILEMGFKNENLQYTLQKLIGFIIRNCCIMVANKKYLTYDRTGNATQCLYMLITYLQQSVIFSTNIQETWRKQSLETTEFT